MSTAGAGIGSVQKTFDIIRAIASSADGPLRLSEIARATGLSRNLAYAYLQSLLAVGAIERDRESGSYALGEAVLRFGMIALARNDFLERARRAMRDLAQEVGESVWLSVWSEQGPVVVARAEGSHTTPFEIRIGSRPALLSSVTGRTFLAHLDAAAWRPLIEAERRRSKGAEVPSNAELRPLLDGIRHRGIASRARSSAAQNTVAREFSALGAPVFDHSGRIKAVLTVIGQSPGFDESAIGPTAAIVRAAAERLSTQLGYV